MKQTRRAVLAGVGVGISGLAGCTAPTDSGRQEPDSAYTQIYRETVDSVLEIHVSDGGQQIGAGSGFVVEDYIVTNHHVVDVGPDVTVQFSDRQWVDATVVGSDPHSDLAVLSLEEDTDLPNPLAFVEQPPPVGEEIVAIGSPFELSESLTQGIISGRNRSVPGPGPYLIPDTIQTDIALNPGNSGGPIVDGRGQVVGVVFANQGETVGFAISAALARRVVPALSENGSYEHSRLGITMQEVDPALASAVDLEEPGGLLVLEVEPDGPADGVLEPSISPDEADELPELEVESDDPDSPEEPPEDSPEEPPEDSPEEPPEEPPGELPDPTEIPTGGDVIVELAGEPVDSSDTLASILALETTPGETISVGVIRDDERTDVDLTLGARSVE